MPVRPQEFREIPYTRIAGDTSGSGESGIARKRQDGMLGGMFATAHGTKLSGDLE
jgi:hypothetical protein